jgi:hypothetical protein
MPKNSKGGQSKYSDIAALQDTGTVGTELGQSSYCYQCVFSGGTWTNVINKDKLVKETP